MSVAVRHGIRSIAVALAAVVVATGPAAHADQRIGLSRDGSTWTSAISAPLFDDALLWVPGDVRTESFWVRNQSQDVATLDVTAVRRSTDDDALVVEARVGRGSWVPLVGSAALPGGTLSAGAKRRVDVRVALDTTSGNATQRRSIPIDFTARLRSQGSDVASTDISSTDAPSGSDDGELASTGAALDPRLLLGALGALGTGLVLLLAGRRRHTEQEEDR